MDATLEEAIEQVYRVLLFRHREAFKGFNEVERVRLWNLIHDFENAFEIELKVDELD